jgi:hypothetical protein|tara:strand:- start:35 stop:577 length:543 start_codon:yes stop_codon:yes gene_type:complete
MKKILIIFLIFFTKIVLADGYDVFGLGYYDVKFDNSNDNEALDFRYERRFDKTLLRIGPESYDFFDIKPFAGFEGTSDSAKYFLLGIYLDDNAGVMFTGKSSKFIVTPSFGFGAYNAGSGKQLGNTLEFRTTIEVSYQFENKNRIGLSFGHISNADLGADNPGVEIISLSYQIPYSIKKE